MPEKAKRFHVIEAPDAHLLEERLNAAATKTAGLVLRSQTTYIDRQGNVVYTAVLEAAAR